jgi:hypothetical protein
MYIPTSPAYNPMSSPAYDVTASYNPTAIQGSAAYSPIGEDESEDDDKAKKE